MSHSSCLYFFHPALSLSHSFLYSPVSFSFHLRGIRNEALKLRRNGRSGPCGLLFLDHCFLAFI